MKTKTTIAIAALAIALAVAYATWTETATITVNAQTGYIDLDFTDYNVEQKPPYGEVSVTLAGSAPGNDGAPSATITIKNAYPGAVAVVKITAYNDGTIPVKIDQCSASGDIGMLTVNVSPDQTKLEPGYSTDITVQITVGSGVQEEMSYSVKVECPYTQAVP